MGGISLTTNQFNHTTVFLTETIDKTIIDPDGTYIDCTAGGGGHAEYALSKLSCSGRLIAFDRDPAAISYLTSKFNDECKKGKFTLIQDSFSNLQSHIESMGLFGKINGIYADLGVSSPQLDEAKRGFSFNKNGPLNMRMDSRVDLITAADLVNNASKEKLQKIFWEFGEEVKAPYIAEAIVNRRKTKIFEQTHDLAQVISNSIHYKKKSKTHPATKSFQAIRIYINNELEELQKLLTSGFDVIGKNGRFSVISFHSLEDRLVKQVFRQISGLHNPTYIPKEFAILNHETKIIKGKLIRPFPLKACEQDVAKNPRSRSAKLRVIEKMI